MAVERKRGCGFRKIGGLYMVSDGSGVPCDRLPLELCACPTCGEGIKPARGFTWIDPIGLFQDNHIGTRKTIFPQAPTETIVGDADFSQHEDVKPCSCPPACPVCHVREHFEFITAQEEGPDKEYLRAGLVWIGEEHYATPEDFVKEGAQMGFSRRISKLPRGFVIGGTWVFMAHRKAVKTLIPSEMFGQEPGFSQGIFLALRPQRIERIVKQSHLDHFNETIASNASEASRGEAWSNLVDKSDKIFWDLKRDADRGITLVPVPDNDPDHRE